MKDIFDKISGHFEMRLVNADGDIIDQVDEKNLIVNYARTAISQCIGGGSQNDHAIKYIAMGEDVGTGDKFNPEQPTVFTDIGSMDLVYQTGILNAFYPTIYSVMHTTTLDGNTIVDAYNTKHGTSQDTCEITSSALTTNSGTFSYKRFPVKVITRFINVELRWTIDVG